MKDRLFKMTMIGFSIFVLAMCAHNVRAGRVMQYAQLSYAVVYVRCPRGQEPVNWMGAKSLLNWNGVNDMWLSASNNIYQQPGCDLVLHHPDQTEEILVGCANSCTVADPAVSLDGSKIAFTYFPDTSSFVSNYGIQMTNAGPYPDHNQSYVDLPSGTRKSSGMLPYVGGSFILEYDLQTNVVSRVSPPSEPYGAHAYPGKPFGWTPTIPIMDTSPVYLPGGRVAFVSNRASGTLRFELFSTNGTDLDFLGHRAMNQQLHPILSPGGKIIYTSFDIIGQKGSNNQYSPFTINTDGSFPFILAGKFDATHVSYHYTTVLSDGSVVVTLYYNHNNGGMGTLLRFPIDPPGPDFYNPVVTQWEPGVEGFLKPGQYTLTPGSDAGDSPAKFYTDPADYWIHPQRQTGRFLTINGAPYPTDDPEIQHNGRFTHPAAGPGNDLLVTYTIGASSTMGGCTGTPGVITRSCGKDAGLYVCHLTPGGTETIDHITQCQLIVDHPEYHEIMPRAVVPFNQIYSAQPPIISKTTDSRLLPGEPFGLTGAATLFDRETRAPNGTPWNMKDGGGTMSGRTYTNLGTMGAELAIFDNSEIYGVRILLPVKPFPLATGQADASKFAGHQNHWYRILGEFPVRKLDGSLDAQGNPDTSFLLKIPANTPFAFQTLDKRGMALDIETTSRSVIPGEKQICGGCHVHTRDSIDPNTLPLFTDPVQPVQSAGGTSPILFAGNLNDLIVTETVSNLYPGSVSLNSLKTLAADWVTDIAPIIQARCSSCHGEGQPAHLATGLRLDINAYELIAKNQTSKPGDSVVPRYSCCTASRWISFNSARSSMLVWALYGERMDGRDPATGLPFPNSEVLVDNLGKEYPETWPNVATHAAYVVGMTEAEKRLIARWIDIGAPKTNAHDDTMAPVLTVTPVLTSNVVTSLIVGYWDESPIDPLSFSVTVDGVNITPQIDPHANTVEVILSDPITSSSTGLYIFQLKDMPNRTFSYAQPGIFAQNGSKLTYTAGRLFEMAGGDMAPPPVNPCDINPASFECCVTTPTNACLPQDPAWFIYDAGTQINQCFVLQ
jgi:hypothetical protein